MRRLKEYLDGLDYAYIKTYVGLRGQEFEILKEENKEKIIKLKKELRERKYKDEWVIKSKIRLLEDEIDDFTTRIIDKTGNLHKLTKELGEHQKNSYFDNQLLRILEREKTEDYVTACVPIYRDAIVFYSRQDEIEGILYICFGCARTKTEDNEPLLVAIEVYDELKELLNETGHRIE